MGVLDIIIKISKQGGADQETISGLYKLKYSLLQTAQAAGSFVAAGYAIKTVLDQTVGKYVVYAAEVRRASEATGMTTEETSRLIQVLDDVKVEYSALEKIIQKNAKTYDYSTQGLAKMSGEYLSLTSNTARAAYMNERFGKSWIDFVPLMKLGSENITAMSAAVNKNMVITDKAEKQTRAYELSVDALKDTWDGFTYSVAPPLMNALTNLINSERDTIRAREILKDQGIWYGTREQADAAMAQAAAERQAADNALLLASSNQTAARATDDWKYSAETLTTTLSDGAEYVKSFFDENIIGTITSLAQANDEYTTTMSELNGQLADGKINQDEYAAAAQNAAAAQSAATAQIVFSLAQMQLAADGWQASDTSAMLSIGTSLGIFTESQADAAASTITQAQAMSDAYSMFASDAMANLPGAQGALQGLTDDLREGRITTQGYREKVIALYTKIKELDGLSATATINLMTRGSVPNIPGSSYTTTHPGYVEAQATGGPLADVAMVGEKGYELIVKNRDGAYTVIPHEAAKWILQAGLMPSQGFASGGTLGGGSSTVASSPIVNVRNENNALRAELRALRNDLPKAIASAIQQVI